MLCSHTLRCLCHTPRADAVYCTPSAPTRGSGWVNVGAGGCFEMLCLIARHSRMLHTSATSAAAMITERFLSRVSRAAVTRAAGRRGRRVVLWEIFICGANTGQYSPAAPQSRAAAQNADKHYSTSLWSLLARLMVIKFIF